MSTRNVMTKQTALAKARERRRQLDRERGEQDERIEAATAATLVALEARAGAERALETARAGAGEMLRLLAAEGVSVDRAAALLDLDASEVRRLLKAALADRPVTDPGTLNPATPGERGGRA